MTPLPQSEWKWFGTAGHLVVASHCRFHLTTWVADWLISTVGEYVPDSQVQQILAECRGIELQGRGDDREADWLTKNGFEKLGIDGTYETMVFLAGEPCIDPDCNCGMPRTKNWHTVDTRRYENRGDATRGHYEFCQKWAAITKENAGEILRYDAAQED